MAVTWKFFLLFWAMFFGMAMSAYLWAHYDLKFGKGNILSKRAEYVGRLLAEACAVCFICFLISGFGEAIARAIK